MLSLKNKIYLVSDTHFGHEEMHNIYSRPKGYEDILIDHWKQTVGKYDTVLHLGDFSFCDKATTWKKYVYDLPGNKFLVRGNHDNNSISWYEDMDFKVIPDFIQSFRVENGGWIKVIFSHMPVWELVEEKDGVVVPAVRNMFNIHGHLHGNAHRGRLKSPIHFDVSLECTDYKIIELSKVFEKMGVAL